MGDTTTGLDFALIGHQESWRAASDVLAVLRGPSLPPIPEEEVQDILPWIPPRTVCHIEARSVLGIKANGVYIDSFIPPDRLGASFLRKNLERVRGAAASAIKAGAKVVSLGGFSSILIEGNFNHLPHSDSTVFTTGNTLTVAFIVQGVKKMCRLEDRDLSTMTMLIVGATGDVGAGCTRCFAPLVKHLVLSARNAQRLQTLATEVQTEGASVEVATDIENLATPADIVICAASLASPSLLLSGIAPRAILCDAGYPKNLSPHLNGGRVFFGGLGQITAGMSVTPDIYKALNRHPFPNVLHGCLLEGMTLALEKRFEPYSQGRGFITRDRVDEIETMAARHGICLAPLYNAHGPIEDTLGNQAEGTRT